MTKSEDIPQTKEQTKVESELWAALERLKKKSVNGQPARISYSAVAAEARRSRTLIGHDDCAYPHVRKAIEDAINAQKGIKKLGTGPTASEPPADISVHGNATINRAETVDPDSLTARLKEQVVFLTKQNRVAAIKVVTIDDENQQLREEIKRLKTELARRKFGGTN